MAHSALLGRKRSLPGVLLLGHRCAWPWTRCSGPHAACMAAQQRAGHSGSGTPPPQHGHSEAASEGRGVTACRRANARGGRRGPPVGVSYTGTALERHLGITAPSQPRRWPGNGRWAFAAVRLGAVPEHGPLSPYPCCSSISQDGRRQEQAVRIWASSSLSPAFEKHQFLPLLATDALRCVANQLLGCCRAFDPCRLSKGKKGGKKKV